MQRVQGENGAGAKQDGGRGGHARGHGQGLHPVHPARRCDRLGEAGAVERLRAAGHQLAVPGRDRRDVVHQPEHLLPQAVRQRHHRQHAEQHRRAELTALALAAHLAALDVPVHPLAEQDGQFAVPAREDVVQFLALLPAGAGDQQRAQRPLELGACPGRERVRVVAGHAERVGQVLAVQHVAQVQLDDLAVRRVQPGERVDHQAAQLLPFRAEFHIRLVGGHLHCRVERGGEPPRPQAAVALVAGHRIQPRTEPVRIAQPVQLGRGDDVGVLHRVGGIGRLTEQRPAVGIQCRSVVVISGSESGRVSCDNRCDDLPVLHGLTVVRPGHLLPPGL